MKTALESSATDFAKVAGAAETAQDHRDGVGGWVDGLESLAGTQKRGAETVARLAQEISEWDKARLTAAEQVESDTAGALKAGQEQMAKAEQRHATLKDQLKEISGGLCPFLKEQCRQFDPTKVQADLEQQAGVVASIKTEVGQAKTAHQKAQTELAELRKLQGKITGKEAELSRAVAGYVDGSESLVPETVTEALAWLVAWEPQIAMMPQVPKLPTENLRPQTVADLQQQFEAFVQATEARWESSDDKIKARLKASNEEAQVRRGQEVALSQSSEQLARIQKEVQGLAQKAVAKETESNQHKALSESTAVQIVKLDESLKPFVSLADELKREQQKRDLNRGGHDRYLGAKKLADDLDGRQARLTQLLADETTALGTLQKANETLQKAEQDFDPEKLRVAREDHQAKHDRATELKVSLETEKKALKKEEKRFQDWEEACKERDRVMMEIGRCEAAMELTELARKTLRDTAPAVAQHLCSRIAKRAQGVFNQINPDPIKLAWDSERYSLRVTPGDRRFAMLSGGEQTKLALAMTLAMIEEFSGLRFCVFDEPTYAVDADSRQKLADAIIQAQEAAGLDQLILVSHDDAFEGKIEHAILLEKSTTLGTAVVLAQ
jgi:exonuclease SbcC